MIWIGLKLIVLGGSALRRKSWICPKCGKPLLLCEPTRFDLPKRMGESSNKIQFYYECKFRLLNITKKPRSMFALPRDYGYFDKKSIKPMGSWIPRGSDCFITTIPYTQKRLEQDKLFFVNREILFLCKNCRQKLSVNHNPFGILRYTCFLLGLTAMVSAFVLIAVVLGNAFIMQLMQYLMITLIVVTLLVGVPSLAFSVLYYLYIKLYISNFVPTDEYDNLIALPKLMLLSGVPVAYRHKSNIFITLIGEEEIYLYITNIKGAEIEVYICGEEQQQKHILQLVSDKTNDDNPLILPLSFEGKHIGNAQIIDIYDCIEEKLAADDVSSIKSKQNWRCDECGFTNLGTSSECKSCGKYRK